MQRFWNDILEQVNSYYESIVMLLPRLVLGLFLFLAFLCLAGLLQIVGLGKAAASLLAGAGISAFVIGFAFKDIGENFLAGILMAFKRPFRVGDIMEIRNYDGKALMLHTHEKTD